MEATAVAAPYSGQPPSPTAVFNELYSFSGFMTRHQMKTLQDTIDQNRQDALNSSCKSSDSLEESLAARQHDYLKNILKACEAEEEEETLTAAFWTTAQQTSC